jgi:hypothetical protein
MKEENLSVFAKLTNQQVTSPRRGYQEIKTMNKITTYMLSTLRDIKHESKISA